MFAEVRLACTKKGGKRDDWTVRRRVSRRRWQRPGSPDAGHIYARAISLTVFSLVLNETLFVFPFFFVLYLSVVIFFIGISFNLFFLAGIDSEISTC